jgi:DNA-binding LytR/AlgR family response regulator
MTCIIVDDEPLAVKLLESFVKRTPTLQLVGTYTDSVEALSALRESPVDLIFLDIQMPDLNGMELAHMLPPQTKVIFTTAFKEYAFESYEVSAVDYLLKPVRYNKFLTAVEKAEGGGRIPQAQEHISFNPPPSTLHPKNTLFIRVDGELRQLQTDDIIYVSGMKDYVMFYVQSQSRPLITHMTMKAVEDMLPSDRFMRVHRSYIVALDKIRKVDRNDCIYIGEEIIHVTEAFRPAFEQFLKQHTAQ